MDNHRRRHTHKHNRFRHLIPAISAISGAILLLYCFLSFLAPSPNHLPTLPNTIALQFDHNAIDDDTPKVSSVFKVPVKAVILEPGSRTGDSTKEGIIDADGEVLARGNGTYKCHLKSLMVYGKLQIVVDQGLATLFTPI